MKGNESSAGSLLIAIVDDDASVRNSTRRLIRSFGLRVEAFASGREFLDSGCVTETACLILDLRMPGMDGLELQCLLASANHWIPVIFVTAHASDDEQRRATQAGAVASYASLSANTHLSAQSGPYCGETVRPRTDEWTPQPESARSWIAAKRQAGGAN